MTALTIYAGIQGVNLSNYAAQKWLNHGFGQAAYTMPTIYVALATNAQYTITGNTAVASTVVACGANIATGKVVTITGSNSTPVINGTFQVTNVDTTHFSIPVTVTVPGTTGTVTLAAGDPVMGFTFTEATQGTGYARQLYVPSAASGTPMVIPNSGQISFGPVAGTIWGTAANGGIVTGIGYFDALTSGNLIGGVDVATYQTLALADVVVIAAGAATASLD